MDIADKMTLKSRIPFKSLNRTSHKMKVGEKPLLAEGKKEKKIDLFGPDTTQCQLRQRTCKMMPVVQPDSFRVRITFFPLY